jgi:hypothetical protein
MSKGAAAYQKQITGCSPIKEFYVTDGTLHAHFDGYQRGVLLEAKYYVRGRFMPRGEANEVRRKLVDQGRRQRDLAQKAGLPLRWHVASLKSAIALCDLFQRNGLRDIPIYFTPPRI